MTISNTPWFQQLCKRAQVIQHEESPPVQRNTVAGRDTQSLDDAPDRLLNPDAGISYQPPESTEPDEPVASKTPKVVDDGSPQPTLEQRSEALAGINLDDDSVSSKVPQTDLADAPEPDAPQQTVQAGIPSAALWAAGGVGAAGLLGYLLTRNRRQRDAA